MLHSALSGLKLEALTGCFDQARGISRLWQGAWLRLEDLFFFDSALGSDSRLSLALRPMSIGVPRRDTGREQLGTLRSRQPFKLGGDKVAIENRTDQRIF